MLQSRESETEILLGNKQLVSIFVVVALLLGVSFTAGYMVGRNGGLKKPVQALASDTPTADTPAAAPTETSAAATSAPAAGGQTHTVGSDDGAPLRPTAAEAEQPLGTRRPTAKAAPPVAAPNNEGYSPRAGAKYLQVAAVSKDEAQAVADVLGRKGFKAHAVPKPGNAKIYRVIIGPIRDAGDLSSTRDSLRKTGFREVIVQTY